MAVYIYIWLLSAIFINLYTYSEENMSINTLIATRNGINLPIVFLNKPKSSINIH